jgi:uncharacterized protein YegL
MTEFSPRVNESNPDPRIACALLLDTSGSMSGDPIEQLNKGFALFCDEIKGDELAKKRAEITVITFGGEPKVEIPFTEGRDLEPRPLSAGGATPLGQALNLALGQLEAQKGAYKQAGLEYYRPWLFVLTDGVPSDAEEFTAAAARVRDAEANRRVSVFCIGGCRSSASGSARWPTWTCSASCQPSGPRSGWTGSASGSSSAGCRRRSARRRRRPPSAAARPG